MEGCFPKIVRFNDFVISSFAQSTMKEAITTIVLMKRFPAMPFLAVAHLLFSSPLGPLIWMNLQTSRMSKAMRPEGSAGHRNEIFGASIIFFKVIFSECLSDYVQFKYISMSYFPFLNQRLLNETNHWVAYLIVSYFSFSLTNRMQWFFVILNARGFIGFFCAKMVSYCRILFCSGVICRITFICACISYIRKATQIILSGAFVYVFAKIGVAY